LTSLQKKYDKLLNIAEEKQQSSNVSTIKFDDIYDLYIKTIDQLEKKYQNQRDEFLIQLKTAKIHEQYAIASDIRFKLKAIKHQYKAKVKETKFNYYLKTLDPIRASYIKERNQLTEKYHQDKQNII
jgi:hypothetical protein